MVELRWAVSAETTTKAPRLQYRQCPAIVSFGSGQGWSEWQDVPWVVVPEAQKAAPEPRTGTGYSLIDALAATPTQPTKEGESR